MIFNDIINNWYSVRTYKDKTVEKELVNQILETGRLAPSAACKNPVIVYNLTEEQILKLKDATQYTFEAKNMFLICYDSNVSHKRKQDNLDFGIQDVSIVTTYMMLKITELGLGSCWVGSFYKERVSQIFNLKDNIIPAVILPFGYIADNIKPNERHFNRKEINEFVTLL